MIEKLSSLIGISQRAGTVNVKNVLSPLLWLCAVIVPVLVLAAGVAGFGTGFSYILIGFVFLLIIYILFFYGYFAVKDPKRLQSESYQLKFQELKMLETKSGQAIAGTLDLRETENPELTAIDVELEDEGDEK